MSSAASSDPDPAERLVRSAETQAEEQARSELFFRQFALHLARQATTDFGRRPGPVVDAADAVRLFVEHEEGQRRLAPGEVTSRGSGYRIEADVHSCPYQRTCQSNARELGEVPQCVRAITLIQAIGARIPERPPMTYDLRPGLVDGTADHCRIGLRPAALPDLEPLDLASWRR